MGGAIGLIGALSKLQRWIKVWTASQEGQAAIDALEVGQSAVIDIPPAAEVRWKGTKKKRYAVDAVTVTRLRDAP